MEKYKPEPLGAVGHRRARTGRKAEVGEGGGRGGFLDV